MSEEIRIVEDPCEGGKCQSEPNLCNDSTYFFTRRGRRRPFTNLDSGDTQLGWAVNEGKAKFIKITWDDSDDVVETLVLTRNGRPIEYVTIDGSDESPKCIPIKEEFCDCDVMNIKEVPGGCRTPEDIDNARIPDEEGRFPFKWKPACSINVVVEYERDCDIHFLPEGDGVAEAIDTTGTTSVVNGATWYTRSLDTERNNTLGGFAVFDPIESTYELGFGVYKIWYESGIEFDQSVNVAYNVKLQENVDGAGWVDIVQSGNVDFILAGDEGNVSAGRMITYRIPHGSSVKIRIQEKITQDTSIQNATGGAGIVIERVANGIATMASLHATV